MKTITTINGQDASLTSISLNRSHGYGQYTLNVQFTWDGIDFEFNKHSTDSQAFDDMRDADDVEDFLFEKFKNTIEDAVSDLISESYTN